MPLYQYRCVSCRNESTELRPIDARRDPLSCSCGAPMQLQVTAPAEVFFVGGGTRNIKRFPIVPLKERLKAQYGSEPP